MEKEQLLKHLVDEGYLRTPRIIEAFGKIDRRDFVPPKLAGKAYLNIPLPIGYGQTISQPLTVAFMLELLEPRPGDYILDVGAGSGWQTALLAFCVEGETKKESGYVVAVERVPELYELARMNLERHGFLQEGVAELLSGDATDSSLLLGFSQKRKFTKIIAAASGSEIPEAWKEILAFGGRIVAPVGASIIVLDKVGEKRFRGREYEGFSFVPLVKNIEK